MPIFGPTTDHREIRSWADRHKVVPTEMLPHRVDHEPSVLQLMFAKKAVSCPDVHMISWDEFFARFDVLGLAFVYDDEQGGYNELLQRDEKAPRIGEAYRREHMRN
jgi:hypothetical protein